MAREAEKVDLDAFMVAVKGFEKTPTVRDDEKATAITTALRSSRPALV